MTAKDLKNALLQEAVQGKLVPQKTCEGNARDLLEEIRKARGESLPLATARKRSSATPSAGTPRNAPMEITEDEIPFDIPESWCWCRLGEYLDIRDGTHDSPKFYNEGIPFVTSKNLNEGILDFSTCKYISEEDHKKFSTRSFVEDGDILFAMIGSIGNPVIVKKEFDFSFKNMALFKRYSKDKTNMNYIFYYLSYIQTELKKIATGGVQSFIGLNTFRQMFFPLPPLAEQKRIVAAIEKFMPLIEEYGKKETVLNQLNAQIGTLTKKAILQEAVQGKLVPQIPAEGNAKDLLEQIKAQKTALIKEGKIKKEKPLPEITEDEIPFDIPENWCWCRLGEIVNYKMGKTPPRAEAEWWGSKKDTPWISIADMNSDGYISKTKETMSPKSIKEVFSNNVSPKGTLIMSFKLTVGRVSILDIDATHNEAIISIFPFIDDNKITRDYLFKLLPLLSLNGDTKDAIKGRTLNSTSLSNMLIPLPPLSEQKRIVAAIEQLLPLCEKLGK